MHDAAIYGASLRSCISLTSDPHHTRPADPEQHTTAIPTGTTGAGGVDPTVQSADAPKTSGALRRLTSPTRAAREGAPRSMQGAQ
eukprot:4995714-Prymnesium_polylepis.1